MAGSRMKRYDLVQGEEHLIFESEVHVWLTGRIQFANHVCEFFDGIPGSWWEIWKRRRRQVKKTTNRAIQNCRNNLAAQTLEAKTIKTIWEWADHPALFLAETNHTAHTFLEGAALPPKPLDSVCILLSHVKTQEQVDRVRQRLLLCFLAWCVQEKIQAVGTQDDVATLLVQSQLISEASLESVKKFIAGWLSKGRQYLSLAELLGGVGAVIWLPFWGESNWYHHCHAGSDTADELVALLRARGVMRDASQERYDGRNAYDVVRKLFKALLDRSDHTFVHYEATSPSRPVAQRVRRSRLRDRRERSPAIPSTPPAIDQRGAVELSSRHLMEPDLLSSYDALGYCTSGTLHSPSILPPSDDDLRDDCQILSLPTLTLPAV